jgi:hypothetical protein
LDAKRIVIFSVVGGLVITLLTGLVTNTTLLGGEWYGYPFAWLILRVLSPEYFPWNVEGFWLVVDTVVWAATFGVLLKASGRTMRK